MLQFLIDNWALVLLAVVSGTMLAWPAITGAKGQGISPTEAVLLMNREKAHVVDVREPAEYATGHIAKSKNIPLANLETAKELPSNKTQPVVLVCQSGARSSRAVGMLKKLGYEKAYSLAGGMAAWQEAQMPTEKA